MFSRILLPEKISGEFLIFSKFPILRIVSLIEWWKSDDKGQERLLLAKKGKWLIMTEKFSVFGFCWKFSAFGFAENISVFGFAEMLKVFR